MNDALPEGFEPFAGVDRATKGMGLYRRIDDHHPSFALKVRPNQCNGADNCHGGILSMLADFQMGACVFSARGHGGPTISLTLDFLEAVPCGRWVQGSARLLKITRRLAFVDCLLRTGDVPVVRGSATFRLMRVTDHADVSSAETDTP